MSRTGRAPVLYSWLDRPFNPTPEMFAWLLEPGHLVAEGMKPARRRTLHSVFCAYWGIWLISSSIIYNKSCTDSSCQEAGFSIISNRDDGVHLPPPQKKKQEMQICNDRPQSTWTLVARRLIAFHVQLWWCISLTQPPVWDGQTLTEREEG